MWDVKPCLDRAVVAEHRIVCVNLRSSLLTQHTVRDSDQRARAQVASLEVGEHVRRVLWQLLPGEQVVRPLANAPHLAEGPSE